MTEKEKKIIEAAVQVFQRYGVKRARMNDIAQEAGIARQTLYNSFANKDDLLRGAIRLHTARTHEVLEGVLGEADTLDLKLALIFNELAMKPYVELHNQPNAQDLIDGFNEAGRDELEAAFASYRELLAQTLSPYADELKASGLTPEELAELVQRAATAYKHQARDKAHLGKLLDGLKALILAVTGQRRV